MSKPSRNSLLPAWRSQGFSADACSCWLLALASAMASFFLLATQVGGQTVLRDGWKVQSSAQVSASGGQVSEPGFSTRGWYTTSAPKTVFAVLAQNRAYKNPYSPINLPPFPSL